MWPTSFSPSVLISFLRRLRINAEVLRVRGTPCVRGSRRPKGREGGRQARVLAGLRVRGCRGEIGGEKAEYFPDSPEQEHCSKQTKNAPSRTKLPEPISEPKDSCCTG